MDSLGSTIRRARLTKNLSLREVSRRLSISAPYLSDIELDRRIPAESVMKGLSRILEIEMTELIVRAGKLDEKMKRYLRKRPLALRLVAILAETNTKDAVLQKLLVTVEQRQK